MADRKFDTINPNTHTFQEAVQMAVEFFRGNAIDPVSFGAATIEGRIEHANKCWRCFEHLQFEIGRKIQRGWTVEPLYMAWASDVMTGDIVPPKNEGGAPSKESQKLAALAAVQHLLDHGLKAGRNLSRGEWAKKHESIIDAVVEAIRIVASEPDSQFSTASMFEHKTLHNYWYRRNKKVKTGS